MGPGMSFSAQGGVVFVGSLTYYGILTAPSRDPSHPGSVPSGQGAQGGERGLLPAGGCPASCSQGARCQAGGAPEVGALSLLLCPLGVNSILCPRGLLSPNPWATLLLAFPGTTSSAASWWEQRGLGVPGRWEPLPLPELSASSPACPAVWPCFASRLLPVLPLTDIVSVGIYISLTTLSPNGIKSKAGDK